MIAVMVALVYLTIGISAGLLFIRHERSSGREYEEPGMLLAFWVALWPIAALAEMCQWLATRE